MLDDRDRVELIEAYINAYALAKELTKDDPKMFKTTFQCTYWEYCHFLFQKKLKGLKQ